MYVFKILDYYSASGICLLVLLFFECISVSWFYGADRFYEDIHDMIKYYPGRFWKWCWISIAIFSLVEYEPVSYKQYRFPRYAEITGWCIALSSISAIPVYAIYILLKGSGTLKQRFQMAIKSKINRIKVIDDGTTEEKLHLDSLSAMTNS
ncbi:unnamed protein product [Didymodactylos carnosus]|uniref:Uncharacterized protein n=1 Tax=Didymodactylos carnosus TaxID=1234261 RepID=A0A8S2VN30_9BILA|nr:unnamed protein product [Didymodactylos carnosus]CAF4402582.1 unnamed protein product [Didymodactylos carnosus]